MAEKNSSNGSRKVYISSAMLLIESILRLVIVAAVSFWIARSLGPGQFGIINFASAFVAILLVLASMGMDVPVVLNIISERKAKNVISAALILRSLSGFLVFVIGIPIAYALKSDDLTAFFVTAIVCLGTIFGIGNVFDYWFKADTSPAGASIARLTGTLISALLKVVCLYFNLGLIALAWAVAIESLITSLGLYLAYKIKNTENLTIEFDKKILRKLYAQSWPYLISASAIIIYMKIDVLMLGYMTTNVETGVYSLTQKLSEVLYIIPVVIIDSVYPSLTRRFNNDNRSANDSGQLLFDLAVGGSIIALLIALLSVKATIDFIFGAEYINSVNIFYLHAWSCIAIAMNTARYKWMANMNLQRYAPVVTIAGLVINVILNFMLIPEYGAMGAAFSTVASYFLSGYFSSFVFGPLRQMGWMQTRSLWPWSRLYFLYKSSF